MQTLLAFVNFKLYHSIDAKYPPILDPRLEALAVSICSLMHFLLHYNFFVKVNSDLSCLCLSSSDLYAFSRYLQMNSRAPMAESVAVGSSGSNQPEVKQKGKEMKESELRLAHLQQ